MKTYIKPDYEELDLDLETSVLVASPQFAEGNDDISNEDFDYD